MNIEEKEKFSVISEVLRKTHNIKSKFIYIAVANNGVIKIGKTNDIKKERNH